MKNNKKNILIYGAGAIGRGYLPWVFSPNEYNFYFVETSSNLRQAMKSKGSYLTHITKENGYNSIKIQISGVYAPDEDLDFPFGLDFIVTAVGPRSLFSLAKNFKAITSGNPVPILCFENDKSVVDKLKILLDYPNIFFGIPDVVTSNTAPDHLLREDDLAIVTEDGICYVDDSVSFIGGSVTYLSKEKLNEQWLAKLYIHNTTHCIAAYCGHQSGSIFLHEAMANKKIDDIVEGAMHEVKEMLIKKFKLSFNFVESYANKELARFRNKLLFDPISRVAREPFRKLLPSERLIGAAQLCLSVGIIPKNILLGIMAAFKYNKADDPDNHISLLFNALNPKDFIRITLDLKGNDALAELLIDTWDYNEYLVNNFNAK